MLSAGRRTGHRLLAVFGAATLIACQATSPGPSSSTPEPASTARAAAPSARVPEPGATSIGSPVRPVPTVDGQNGRLLVGQSTEISTLDPAIGYDLYSQPWERLIFETLVTYDTGTNLVPRLAASMPQVTKDGRRFRFTLRQDVYFVSPDGSVVREVTADDVAHSLNRLLDQELTPVPSPVGASYFAGILGAADVLSGSADVAVGIQVIDPQTIEIEISDPDPTFLNILAMPFASIVPAEHAGTDTSAFSLHPVGTGPYLLSEWTPAQGALFVSNPHYWDSTFSGPAEIEVKLGMDPDNQVRQVQTDKLHIAVDNITPGQYASVVGDPRWTEYIKVTDTMAVNFITLDTSQEGPLGDVLVRRAISHAIDKENLVRLTNNRNSVAGCFIPTHVPGHDPSCNPYPYSPDRARALLGQAGYGDGFATRLLTYDVEPGPVLAQAVQQDLDEVGIDVEVTVLPFSTLLETMAIQGQAPMVMLGWIADFPSPSNFVDPIITCAALSSGYNTSWYCNEEIDRLVAEARGRDFQQRIETYQRIQRIAMDDAIWVPFEYPGIQIFVHPSVDFHFHPVWQFDYARYRVRG